MTIENTKYILACDFEFFKPHEILADKDLEENPDLLKEFVIVDKLYNRTYLINESIYNFLQLFEKSILFSEVLAQLNIDTTDLESVSHIQNFFDGLRKKGIIVSENENEKIRTEQDIHQNMPQIHIKGCETIKVFKHDFNMWVGLVKRTSDNSTFVVKKLLLDSVTSKKQKLAFKHEFEQEFAIMKEVSEHSAVCRLLAYDEINSEAQLEYIEGESLRRYVKNRKPSLSKRLELITSLLDAFAYMQTKNVLHGDIHASNFMVDKKENLRILDFGMSNHLEPTENEVIKKGGAYFYIPPERVSTEPFSILNRKKTDYYAENYQLGLIMYFILYGKIPFEGLTWKVLSKKILEKDVIFETQTNANENIPKHVIEIIDRTLQKKPENRFANAQELLDAWTKKL